MTTLSLIDGNPPPLTPPRPQNADLYFHPKPPVPEAGARPSFTASWGRTPVHQYGYPTVFTCLGHLPWGPCPEYLVPTPSAYTYYINTWHATHVLALPVPHEAHPFRSQPGSSYPHSATKQAWQPSPAQPARLELTDAGAIVGPSSLKTYTQTVVSLHLAHCTCRLSSTRCQ